MSSEFDGAIVEPPTGLVRRTSSDVVLRPVMDVHLAKQRLEELQDFCAHYLQESKDGGTDGGDYGIIPGAGQKKVLLKSGAEKLCDVYGLADRYRIVSKVEDFDRGLFDYTLECTLVRKTDEMFVGSGLGSCSTYESKYRWRTANRACPRCGQETIIRGKAEYGGGWICWKTKGGCGAKFTQNDPAIADQKIGRTANPDIMDTKNTVLKIAKKRAKIDAVIGVTRSSGLFTQDLDEHAAEAIPPPDAVPPPVATVTDADAGMRPHEDLPAGLVRIQEIREAPTRNPGVIRYSVILSTGEEVTTINQWLASLAQTAQEQQTPVRVVTKPTKFGTQITAIESGDPVAPDPVPVAGDMPF